MFNIDGDNTSAVFGFFRSLFSFLTEYKPEYFAVAMDSLVPTFRHEQYEEYKATRDKTPEDLHDQIPRIEKILEALSINTVRVNRYEADDIIATFADLCRAEKRECYILTGDKDLMQLVDDYVKVLKSEKGGYSVIDHDGVIEHYGVRPDQIIDYLSLTGDSADNIPGVKGIGPKTAVNLLSEYGTVEGIYDNIDKLKAGPAKKMTENRDNCMMSRELVVLDSNVPVEKNIEDFSTENISYRDARPLFERENTKSLVKWIDTNYPGVSSSEGYSENSLFSETEDSSPEGSGPGANNYPDSKTGKGKLPVDNLSSDYKSPVDLSAAVPASKADPAENNLNKKGEYETVLTYEDLDRWIELVKKEKIFAFDIETDNLDTIKANPVGFSISVKSGTGCYIPLIAGGEEILSAAIVKNKLKKIIEDKDLKLVGQNIKYDYKVLRMWGLNPSSIWFDTMIAAWLVNSRISSYSMDNLAEYYLGYKTVHFSDIVPKDKLFQDIDLDTASFYAAEDADITFRLYEILRPLVETGHSDLFYKTEMPLVYILSEMELEGVRVRKESLDALSRDLEKSIDEITEEVHKLCGKEFNISSTKQLQEVLFTDRKLKPVKKTKTGFSTDNTVLEILANEDPVPALVLKYRVLAKLKSTYSDALPKLIQGTTSRIHTTYRQTGTQTGRLSSTNPNLQNIPIKDEEGRKIRKAFVPSGGKVFLSADYSQIELVVLAHLSEDPGLIKAFTEGIDVHRMTGSLIFQVAPEEVTSEQRRIAKTINFGVMYGMSGFRLSRELKIPRKQADEFINSYFERYANIRKFIDTTVQHAEETGSVSTILGRERVIAGINSRNRNEKNGAERMAVNTPIQGSAADIVKLAMLTIDGKLKSEKLKSKLVLQVHDELIYEVPFSEIDRMKSLVKFEMENVFKLKTPLRVSIETGESWGEMH